MPRYLRYATDAIRFRRYAAAARHFAR